MKVYIGIKFHADQSNRNIIEGISAALEDNGFRTTCVVRDLEKWGEVHYSSQELMRETFRMIDSSDVVVIELSEKGVGLGIEAGYAWARGLPIVIIALDGSDISTTLRGLSGTVLFYNEYDQLADLLAGVLGHDTVAGEKG
jgi:nucleoside 2-deoxyribosyltransferase